MVRTDTRARIVSALLRIHVTLTRWLAPYTRHHKNAGAVCAQSNASEPSKRLTVSIHENGVVLFDVVNGRLFTSNITGARIWRGYEQHLSVNTISAELGREYLIDQTIARSHTMQFLSDLQRHGLIERSPN